MTPGTRWLAVAVLVALLLAGCGDRSRQRTIEVSPGQVIEVEEPIKPSNGIVAGLVGNDALYPLAGVFVRIVGLDLNGTSDDSGRFAIVNVPPGIYIVEGSKKDHKSVQATVDVQPGQVAKAILLLERVPPTDPYHITWGMDAYLGMAAAGVTSSSNMTLEFSLDPSAPVTLVLESTWTGAVLVPLTDRFLAYRLASLNDHEVVRDTSANPFWLHVDAGILPPGQVNFRFTIGPDELQTLAYDAQGQTFVTVFYNEAAPPEWSLLAGST
ncbi:MAG: carboxypeptidase-like regulatory domain-containing protein [Candidatus Thermoplasmatota archaeon]